MQISTLFAAGLAAIVPAAVNAGLLAQSLPGCPQEKVNVTQNGFYSAPMSYAAPMSSHRNPLLIPTFNLHKRNNEFATFAYYVNCE